MPLAGGAAVTIANGQSSPQGIAVDDANIYWTIEADSSGNGGVMRAPVAGGVATELASDQNGPLAIATDGTNVFCTDPGGDPLTQGTVVKIAVPRP